MLTLLGVTKRSKKEIQNFLINLTHYYFLRSSASMNVLYNLGVNCAVNSE